MSNQSEPNQSAGPPFTQRNHRTVLVRFWRVDEDQPWRATLLPSTGEGARHFAGVSQLFAHLWNMLEASDQTDPQAAYRTATTGAANAENMILE